MPWRAGVLEMQGTWWATASPAGDVSGLQLEDTAWGGASADGLWEGLTGPYLLAHGFVCL